MLRHYKIRIYPSKEQEKAIWNHIHACRFMWNYMLELQNTRYKNGEKHLSHFGMTHLIKEIKNNSEYLWLKNISSGSLGLVCRELHDAFDLYFLHIHELPKFKSKKNSKASYPIRSDRLWFDGAYAKVDTIGKIRYKTDYFLPIGIKQKFYNSSIKYDSGKYMLCFSIECEKQAYQLNNLDMGIDLGVKDLAVVAIGDKQIKVPNINHSAKIKKLEDRLKYYQSRMDKKYNKNGKQKTNNYNKLKEKYRKVHKKLSDIRKDYTHQVTHTLVGYLPQKVVMETLFVSKMGKDKKLKELIHKQGFCRFKDYMKYKCEWRGINFILADQYFPSSKTCSCCGAIKRDLRLSDRVYKCDECGFVIDRDYNAAINLMRYTG